MNKQKPYLCIYHGYCADGFTGAWVVRRALGEENVEFHPGVYGEPVPDVTGRKVILVDFSYKKDTMLEMIDAAESVVVIDHHESAERDLSDLPESNNLELVFDMNHSGAMLAWMYFYPDVEPPELIKHVEDRDIWKFKMPYTREIQLNVFSYPYEFEVWDSLIEDTDIESLKAEGIAIARKHDKDIAEFVAATSHRLNIGGYEVTALNCTYMMGSDLCDTINKGVPFVAYYYRDGQDRIKFGLRSDLKSGGVNVAKIAEQYGGGGHAAASGFAVSVGDFAQFELNAKTN